MDVQRTELAGVLIMVPQPHHDSRGFFTRTFESDVAAQAGLDPNAFIQDSQSRSLRGVVRGMHGRGGAGEGKLVRCARGAVWDTIVDARVGSPTFGRTVTVVLDDTDFRHLYVPPGFLHGYQVLSDVADVCYRIDREHDPTDDLAVHYLDPDLAIPWPAPVSIVSDRDQQAGTWADLRVRLGA